MVERTKTKGKARYRKIGGGTFRLRNGRIIKPNQVFTAEPHEIPQAFKDTLIALDPEPEEEGPKPASNKPRFEVTFKGGGWYDVVNTESGKAANSKSLRAEEAQRLLEELT